MFTLGGRRGNKLIQKLWKRLFLGRNQCFLETFVSGQKLSSPQNCLFTGANKGFLKTLVFQVQPTFPFSVRWFPVRGSRNVPALGRNVCWQLLFRRDVCRTLTFFRNVFQKSVSFGNVCCEKRLSGTFAGNQGFPGTSIFSLKLLLL